MIFTPAEETIFGYVRERNVCFVVDVSGSMYNKLPYVKEHLIEFLKRRAIDSSDTMFNVISFKETVDKWADRLIQCTTTTVNLAASWIRALSCGTSTDALAALYEAVSDHTIEAIFMVTDGLPHHRATTILDHVQSVLKGIPVHSIYVATSNHTDPAAYDFLRDVAAITRGSSHVVTLTNAGHVRRVRPIYNCGGAPRYPVTVLDPVTTPSHPDLPYDTATRANLLPPSNVVPFTMATNSTTVDPIFMEYAESLNYSKQLAKRAGLAYSATPAASLVLKGAKVLARNDADGLYYLGEVKEQVASNDGAFVVMFEQCAALRKPRVQETHVRHMIAYQDAFRSDITLGDKVLSPWQRDGRYAPGTVLDGLETRTASFSGDQRDGLLVTFYNGETVNVDAGLAVRIPTTTHEQITRDLQLPESQRRKLKYATENDASTVAYPDHIRTSKRAWDDNALSDELWKRRIDEQLAESTHLLDALDLDRARKHREEIIGKASSSKIPEYDSGVFSSDDDVENTWRYEDTPLYEDYGGEPTFSKSKKKVDFGRSLRFSLPHEKIVAKSQKRTEQEKPKWRHSGNGSGGGGTVLYSPLRETVLERPKRSGDRLKKYPCRPAHREYQTTTGVSFPEGTDRKFVQPPLTSTPFDDRIPDTRQKQNDAPVSQPRPHNQHSEYQDVTGIRFPPKTDKKFTRSVDVNWRPETALENAEAQRTRQGGCKEPRNGRTKVDRSDKRGYFKEIEDKVAVNERKQERSVEFRRQKNMERIDRLMEADETEGRSKVNRTEYKTAKKSGILQGEQQRSGQVEQWEKTRIEYRRERLTRYMETEEANDARRDTREAVRQRRRRMREAERRGDFDDRLREEWRTEDQKAEQVRQKNEARRDWEEKREQQAEEKKQARLAARQERLHRYRNRVFPG